MVFSARESHALPIIILVGLVVAFVTQFFLPAIVVKVILLIVVAIGSFDLVKQTWQSLKQGRAALDYIALTAIVTGVISGEFFVAGVICLMLAGGNELENYAKAKSAHSLRALVSRIPESIYLWTDNKLAEKILVKNLVVGQTIAVRRGEVLPVDGHLASATALIDEASLTGEAAPVQKTKGDLLMSGTVNSGDQLVMEVTKTGAESTYHKIISLVSEAQSHKSPLIRLADRYSVIFTIVTFVLAGGAWLLTGSIDRALAVLVMATPCPLILAAPIALLGGMNALAKRGIIIKNLGSLEHLSHATDLVFDKTGTITLGELAVTKIISHSKTYSENEILTIAAAIERSSLHPIAKAIVKAAQNQKLVLPETTNATETVGTGISAIVQHQNYTLKAANSDQAAITLFADETPVGTIELQDQPKTQSATVLTKLKNQNLNLHLISGDTQTHVDELLQTLKITFKTQTQCSPEEKTQYVQALQQQQAVVVMVGDGINDAPAIATAQVGVVFSHDEASASSNAADVVLLTNNFSVIQELLAISKTTFGIAMQSIFIGMALSSIGMVFASLGYIPPIMGSLAQEVIDVLVILNALRASQK